MDRAAINKLLKEHKLVSSETLATLERDPEAASAPSWEEFLVTRQAVDEQKLLKVKSEVLEVPVVDLREKKIEQDVLALVPEPIAHRHRIISFAKEGSALHLAMLDPTDLQIQEFIQKKTGLTIKPFLTGKTSLEAGLSRYHSNLEGEIKNLFAQPGGTSLTANAKAQLSPEEGLKKMAEEIPVIRVVDTLLEYAVFEKASDIHIEPQENSVIVRYRIDGILHDVMTLPKAINAALVARIKVLANLKIDEHRLPQDGRFKVEREGIKFSLRVSTIPVFDGEKIVMRLLDEGSRALTLEELGFFPDQLELVDRNIHKPHGMMLITGPTGSGKSTTLYAILTILNTRNVNISTIEDPVEYHIERVNQMQVNPKIGLTFAIGLRALLRQDPNIIMIGEIRDKETAEEAVHAAMTGHVVLTTLHTNSAAGALPRLMDIGVEPYLISSTTNAVMAQRLVRVLCQNCKKERKLDNAFVTELAKQFDIDKLLTVLGKQKLLPKGAKKLQDITFFQPVGCDKCGKTGYKGRVGIHEILEVTPEIATMIMTKAQAGDIQAKAEEQGMVLMWEDGFMKAAKGLTTVEEVLRVSKE